jgi:TPR repeat protein
MCEKGKGGLEKDLKQSRHWFEESAIHGYNQSFIRLAALAKHENNPKEAWQWYTLAMDSFDDGDAQQYVIRARKALVEQAKLSDDDIDQARKAIDDWKDARDKQLHAEKDAAAAQELLQKAQEEKDAKDGAANSVAATAVTADKQDKKPDPQEKEDEQN